MHTSEGMRPGRTPQMDVPFHAVGRHQDTNTPNKAEQGAAVAFG
jgi:hypothetical protein